MTGKPTSPTTDRSPPPSDSWWTRTPDGIRIAVTVTTGAKRSQITGIRDGALHIRVATRPIDGAANRALIDHLRRELGVPKRSVTIERGEKARRKSVLIREAGGSIDPSELLPAQI